MEDLDQIIASSSLVLQRVLSVKMILKGYSYAEIQDLLGVSPSFVEKWRALYRKKVQVVLLWVIKVVKVIYLPHKKKRLSLSYNHNKVVN